jgi:hypothetical protein
MAIDRDSADRTRVTVETNFRRKAGEPSLAVDSDSSYQGYFDISERAEGVEDFACWAGRNRIAWNDPAKTGPAGRDSAVGVQYQRLGATCQRDRGVDFIQALYETEHYVLLTEDQARRAYESIELAVGRQHVDLATAERPSSFSAQRQCACPFDPGPQQVPRIGQDDILVPILLEREKLGWITRAQDRKLARHAPIPAREQRDPAEARLLKNDPHVDRQGAIAPLRLEESRRRGPRCRGHSCDRPVLTRSPDRRQGYVGAGGRR